MAAVVLTSLGAARAEDAPRMKLARVKDVASVEGVRDNQLVGYGIVVGLHGTGDSSQTVFPLQTLESALERMGVSLQGNAMASMMQTRNMAAVFLSGTLPPFAEPGNKVDVTVSSAGDATESRRRGAAADARCTGRMGRSTRRRRDRWCWAATR